MGMKKLTLGYLHIDICIFSSLKGLFYPFFPSFILLKKNTFQVTKNLHIIMCSIFIKDLISLIKLQLYL